MGEVNGSLRNEVLEHLAWPSSTELGIITGGTQQSIASLRLSMVF